MKGKEMNAYQYLQRALPEPVGAGVVSQERIWQAIAGSDGWLTRSDIAALVGCKKHPAFIRKLEAMVADGVIERAQTTYKNGVLMYVYRVVVS